MNGGGYLDALICYFQSLENTFPEQARQSIPSELVRFAGSKKRPIKELNNQKSDTKKKKKQQMPHNLFVPVLILQIYHHCKT